jgi:hypothetical protein
VHMGDRGAHVLNLTLNLRCDKSNFANRQLVGQAPSILAILFAFKFVQRSYGGQLRNHFSLLLECDEIISVVQMC